MLLPSILTLILFQCFSYHDACFKVLMVAKEINLSWGTHLKAWISHISNSDSEKPMECRVPQEKKVA